MSNYPPGVTGGEPQIAGPLAEYTETHSCGDQTSKRILTVASEAALAHLQGALTEMVSSGIIHETSLPALANYVSQLEAGLIEVDVICPFDGPVDVAYFKGYATWTCPECGTEHDIEPSDD